MNRRIFLPTKEFDARPEDLGLAYEDVGITAGDGALLHAWFFPGSRGVTWIFFHGNAGNISHRLDLIAVLQAGLGVGILLLDYRGYGLSEGTPDEAGVYLDALAAIDWTHKRNPRDRIVYYGRSLGAAVATEMALHQPPDALILEAAFTSMSEMAIVVQPLIGLLVRPWLRGRFDNLAKIRHITSPVLIIHGDRDETVPFEQGARLYRDAPRRKEFLAVGGASHTESLFADKGRYIERVSRFEQRCFLGWVENDLPLSHRDQTVL